MEDFKETEVAKEENSVNYKEPKKIKQKQSKNFNFNLILSLVAFVGIGCIAISLLLTLVFERDSNLSNAFSAIGQVIAYILCIILAFSWVKAHKKSIVWIVLYVVFVVTIVVLFILTVNIWKTS